MPLILLTTFQQNYGPSIAYMYTHLSLLFHTLDSFTTVNRLGIIFKSPPLCLANFKWLKITHIYLYMFNLISMINTLINY